MIRPTALRIRSEAEMLRGDLYGDLPAGRAVILVHGRDWDASGWSAIAPRFAERGVPALALDLRGHGRSTGVTGEVRAGKPWSAVTDLAAAKAALRRRGAEEIALVGASLGGYAVMGSSFEGDVESLVVLSSPVGDLPDGQAARIIGRKLFICADEDYAAPHVIATYQAAVKPKALLLVGGAEHSRRMFDAPYAADVIDALVEFACRRG